MESKKKTWAIECENLYGYDETYYFTSYEVAVKNFLTLADKHKNKPRFARSGNACTWFDSDYNEYSTYITLTDEYLPRIHDDIIF